MSEEVDWDNYETGPFCRHFSSPWDCEEICSGCSHRCTRHEYEDGRSGCMDCDCQEWQGEK